MASIQEQIQDDLKAAMRSKHPARLRTLRSMRAALQKREIALREEGQGELSEEDELIVLRKEAKQRRDSIAQYEEGGREDLAEKEREELEIIDEYLPEQLDDDRIRKVLHEVISATGATSIGDMGTVMGEAMKRLRGRADGSRVNAIVRELLTSGNSDTV